MVGASGSQAQHVRGMLWESWGTFGRPWAVIWCFGMRHFAPWWMTVVCVGLASSGASSRVSGRTGRLSGRWILHQTGMPTSTNTRLWNHLQLLLPSPHDAILTSHTCPEEGPLAVLCGDLHQHPKGTINTIDLVRASITVVYVTLSRMRVLHHSGAHHTPFLQLPEWPQYRLFHRYLTQTARAVGHTLPESTDMLAAYREFK